MRSVHFSLLALVAACAGVDGNSALVEVSGSIAGLKGSFVVLEDRGKLQQTFTADGSFKFNIRAGQPFDIVVREQPSNPDQFCAVANGSGVAKDKKDGVTVTCRELAYHIAGRVSGLAGTGLTIKNGDDEVALNTNGLFTMSKLVAASGNYEVTVVQQPQEPNQACVVDNGKGVVSEFDINNITITCTTNTVNPLYPSHGRNWNDWVKNDGPTPWEASDTACIGDEIGRNNPCLHAGQLRVFFVPGETKCEGLTAVDDRDALEWMCVPGQTPSTRMVSIGLKKNFSDLVDFNLGVLHKPIVTVRKGDKLLMKTEPSIWWQNPLVNAEDGGTMNVANGAIVIGNRTPENTYLFSSSRLTFLVPPGQLLRGPASASPLFQATNVHFVWIEGAIDAVDAANGVAITTSQFVVLRNLSIKNAQGGGLNLTGVRQLQAKGVRLSHNQTGGLFTNVSFSTFEDVIATDNDTYGLQFTELQHSLLTRVLAASNGGDGISLAGTGHDNVLLGITAALNGNAGVHLGDNVAIADFFGTRHRVADLLLMNNATGLALSDADGTRLYDVAATHNGTAGLSGVNLTDVGFSGLLLVGQQATSCSMGAGTVGLNNSCTAVAPSSDLSVNLTASLADTFVGAVTADDAAHPTDTNGLVAAGGGSDLFHFASHWRVLGTDGLLAAAGTRGQCSTPSCRIFDFALSDATVVRGVHGIPTSSSRQTHRWSAFHKAGCDQINGALFASNACVSSFLANAVERSFDAFGNDNGLCEANERCDYFGSLGADQGVLDTPLALGAGQVTNVTLFVKGND